jgi:hypothetical protein
MQKRLVSTIGMTMAQLANAISAEKLSQTTITLIRNIPKQHNLTNTNNRKLSVIIGDWTGSISKLVF